MRRDPSSLGTARKRNGKHRNLLRSITLALLIAAGLLVFLGVVSPSGAEEIPPPEVPVKADPIPAINQKTNEYRKEADYWGHKLRIHVPYSHTPVAPSKSVQYEIKRRNAWLVAAKRYEAKYRQYQIDLKMYARANKDWHLAVKLAAKRWGVSAEWLHACSHSEGGHGRWVPNSAGSGAGGWMQFMRPTFYGYSGIATRGLPRQYNDWYSMLGQAYTGAYMFSIGESNQWTGAAC